MTLYPYGAWEPIPYTARQSETRKQKEAYDKWRIEPLSWQPVSLNNFPADGIFGRDRDWFAKHDIGYTTCANGFNCILIERIWHGFPDPPEWGFGFQCAQTSQAPWQVAGSFERLPQAWVLL